MDRITSLHYGFSSCERYRNNKQRSGYGYVNGKWVSKLSKEWTNRVKA